MMPGTRNELDSHSRNIADLQLEANRTQGRLRMLESEGRHLAAACGELAVQVDRLVGVVARLKDDVEFLLTQADERAQAEEEL